ncbi:hypothetical protein LBMAG53_05680 [Planctomycetota bacterium]|nr:hypothetical protein LBMAG53_05680 [Planctomycetota bacterium]
MTEAPPPKPDLPAASLLGLVLFAGYCALYAGFIGLAVFAPEVMAKRVAVGGNVAIWYGMALIVSAVVLAGIYALVRRAAPVPQEAREVP